MKKLFISVIAFCLLVPELVFAEEIIKGTIQGYKCVTKGTRCDASFKDPVVDKEGEFVLYTKDKRFYYVPNVERYRLSYLVGKQVRITGVVNAKRDSILARTIEDKKDGEWTVYMIFNNSKQSYGPEKGGGRSY